MSLLDKPYWCILSGVTQEDTYMGLALSLHRGIVCLAAFWVLPLPSPPPPAGFEPTPTIQSDQPLAALYPLSYEQGYVGPLLLHLIICGRKKKYSKAKIQLDE